MGHIASVTKWSNTAFGLMFWNIITSYRFMKRCPVSTHCVASCAHRGRICACVNVEILTLRHFIHNQVLSLWESDDVESDFLAPVTLHSSLQQEPRV